MELQIPGSRTGSVLWGQKQMEALCFVHTGGLCVTFFPFEFKTLSPGMGRGRGVLWRLPPPPLGGAPERVSPGSLPQRICPLLPTASDHPGCLPPCLKATLCPAPHPTPWDRHRAIYAGVGQGWRHPALPFPLRQHPQCSHTIVPGHTASFLLLLTGWPGT